MTSSDTCEVGCKRPGPHGYFMVHDPIATEQREEGLRREEQAWGEYPPLGDPEETPFTTDGTPDESPPPGFSAPTPFEYAWYRDAEVEVVDPIAPGVLTEQQIRTLQGLGELAKRVNAPTFEDEADAIFAECRDLLIDRQVKYGPRNIEQQGFFGVLTRIKDDKISRIMRTLNGRVVNGVIELDPLPTGTGGADDSLEDAIKDLVNYGVILLLLLRDAWGRPLAADVE